MLIVSDSFVFISIINVLRIQTVNTDSHREIVHFLKGKEVQYHLSQPQEVL